ncbi:MAG: hypothetical protein NTY30_02945 [Candidatus Berkelbacteria bacterium]|nr:hypothetical protein [Candidatus Berkelbacteria bacterium]
MNLSGIIVRLAEGNRLVLMTRDGNLRAAGLCHRLCELDFDPASRGTWAEAGSVWDALAQLNLSLVFGPWNYEQMYGPNGYFPTRHGAETYGPLDELVRAGRKVDIRQSASYKIELTCGALEIVADSLDEAIMAVRT